jgi:hypothetical protein
LTDEPLERHRPLLRYDSQGAFRATSIEAMATGAVLRRSKGMRVPKPGLRYLVRTAYPDGVKVSRQDDLDIEGREYVEFGQQAHQIYGDVCYGRTAYAGHFTFLQYWFFYVYNDKAFAGVGLHEGDWEMVQIRVGSGNQPDAMTFAQHTYGHRRSWGQVEHDGGPVVYVARGSQASYPEPGRFRAPVVPDIADGRGPLVKPELVVLSGREPWLAWPGRWGSTRARSPVESWSPHGPAHQAKWRRPLAFHQEALVG